MNRPANLGALLRSNSDTVDSPAARRVAKDAVLAFFRAVGTRDAAALAEAITEDAVYEIPFTESGSSAPGSFRRYEGRAAVVDFWMATIANGPKNLGAEEIEISVTGDGSRLFIEQWGNMVLPDGRPYRNRYVFRFSIRDGRVSHVREYFNPVIAAYAFRRKIANAFLVETL